MPFAGANKINGLARKASISAVLKGNQRECAGTEWNAWEGFIAGKLRGISQRKSNPDGQVNLKRFAQTINATNDSSIKLGRCKIFQEV